MVSEHAIQREGRFIDWHSQPGFRTIADYRVPLSKTFDRLAELQGFGDRQEMVSVREARNIVNRQPAAQCENDVVISQSALSGSVGDDDLMRIRIERDDLCLHKADAA
jgi:hypothetical protein